MMEPVVDGDRTILDIDPFTRESMDSPHVFDEAVREAAEVVWLPEHEIWFVGRYETVDHVFRDYETFESSSGTGLTNIKKKENWRKPGLLLDADPPSHTKYRRLMASIVSQRVIRRLAASFQEAADELVERVVTGGELDIATDVAEAYPLSVLPDAVGFAKEGRENLLPYSNINFQAMGPRNELYDAAVAEAQGAPEYVAWQMRREAIAPDSLGSAIFAYADNGEIAEEDAEMMIRTFLSASLDTTILGIGFALRALAEDPEAWASIVADPQRARLAFEEGLRWNSPSPFIGRTTAKETEIGGTKIGAGEKVIMNLAAANRDPRRWDAPDVFDLDRNNAGHLAFGTGIHGCVGQMTARMEAQSIISALARRVKTMELAGEPERFYSNWLRGYAKLPVNVTLN